MFKHIALVEHDVLFVARINMWRRGKVKHVIVCPKRLRLGQKVCVVETVLVFKHIARPRFSKKIREFPRLWFLRRKECGGGNGRDGRTTAAITGWQSCNDGTVGSGFFLGSMPSLGCGVIAGSTCGGDIAVSGWERSWGTRDGTDRRTIYVVRMMYAKAYRVAAMMNGDNSFSSRTSQDLAQIELRYSLSTVATCCGAQILLYIFEVILELCEVGY